MPNTAPPTTDAPERDAARERRTLILRVALTFIAVLAVAIAAGLALQPFTAPVGSTALDRQVTDWYFTWRTPRGLTNMTRVSWLGGPILVVPITVAVTLALTLARRLRLAACFFVTVAGAALLNVLARSIVDPRKPPGALGLRHPFASSFPSGHAAEATATYVGLGVIVVVLMRSRAVRVLAWTVAAALILAVDIARVYLAVHWTTDVLVGSTIGALWAFGMAHAFRLRSAPSDDTSAASG